MNAARGSGALLLSTLVCALSCGEPEPPDAPRTTRPPSMGHVVGPQPGVGRAPDGAENPYGDDARAVAEGRELFVSMNCSGCHGGHAGGGMGPSLRDAVWIYGDSDADVFSSIAQGRARGMPAWGTKLPAASLWKMVAYIQCLNRPCEASPPPPNRSYPTPPPARQPGGRTVEGPGDDG